MSTQTRTYNANYMKRPAQTLAMNLMKRTKLAGPTSLRSNRNWKQGNGRIYGPSIRGPYRQLVSTAGHQTSRNAKPELKFFDASIDGSAVVGNPTSQFISSTGVVACLNKLVQGTGPSQYLGNFVVTKSIDFRLAFYIDACPNFTNMRVSLVWDKQPNGTLAAYSDIYQLTTPGTPGIADYLTYMNMSNRDRFVILRSVTMSLSVQGDQVILENDHVKIDMKTVFGASGTVPTTGALLITYAGDQDIGQPNLPLLDGWIRTRFIDN